MITFGFIIGGPESICLSNKIIRLSSYIHDHSEKLTKSASINIVYHHPGRIISPDYKGMRDGKFSKKDKTIMIQISVPVIIQSTSKDISHWNYIFSSITEAINLANRKFIQKKIAYSVNDDINFVNSLVHLIPFEKYAKFDRSVDSLEKQYEEVDNISKELGLDL